MQTHRVRTPRAGTARSAGRLIGLGASALVIAAGLLATPAAAPKAAADDCPDVEVIFARGTNEPPGLGRVGDAFVDSLRQQTNGLNILPYGVNYAASKLQLHGGDGANDTIDRVKKSVEKCPNTKIVLGGYSQGASVMDIVAGVPIGGIGWGSSLPPQYANNIAAVATFGDVADRAGGTLSSQSAMLGSKAIDLCNPNDPICHAGPGNASLYALAVSSPSVAFVGNSVLGYLYGQQSTAIPISISTLAINLVLVPICLVLLDSQAAAGTAQHLDRHALVTGFAKAVKAGVRIAFGTDAGVYPHGDNARQFAYMVRFGLTPMDAIRAATLNSAQLLDKEKELGSITAGKFADLIAVDGDPLQDVDRLRQVRGVIKAGRQIRLD